GASFFELFGPDLHDAVLGAIGGYGFLWCVYWGFKLLTGKEGMGHGDFKLLGALGAWLGWQVLPMLLVISAGVGAVVGVALLVTGRAARGKPMPFGPYLAIAGIIGLFWREDIVGFLFAGTRL
ncbi:MAG: A24 family peptidase, partial [Gammaproteobacteria bacterium]